MASSAAAAGAGEAQTEAPAAPSSWPRPRRRWRSGRCCCCRPRPVSPGRLARLAARLHGAELLQPDSGQLLRVARHADSGPLVTAIGHCRAGGLTPLPLPAPAPAGWRDLRVINKTYRAVHLDWFYPNPPALFSGDALVQDLFSVLRDTMGFQMNEFVINSNHMNNFVRLFESGAADFAINYMAWNPERHHAAQMTIPVLQYDNYMFVGTPEPTSSPSYSGSLESVRLQVLAVCLLLLVTAGGYLTYRLSGTADTRFSTFCLQTLGTFCAQGLALQPGSVSQHIAAVVMLVVGMMAFQFYAAGFLAQVTSEQARLPFTKPDDIIDMPGWKWAVFPRSTVDHTLRNHRQPGMDFTDAMTRAQNASSVSQWTTMAGTQKFAFFLAPLDIMRMCSWSHCPHVCPHPQRVSRHWGHVPFRRGLSEWRAFDAALLRLMETGLLSRLRRRRVPERLLRSVERCDLEARPRTQWSAISLPECRPVFGVLLGGAAAALVLLLLELLGDRLSDMQQQQQKQHYQQEPQQKFEQTQPPPPLQ